MTEKDFVTYFENAGAGLLENTSKTKVRRHLKVKRLCTKFYHFTNNFPVSVF